MKIRTLKAINGNFFSKDKLVLAVGTLLGLAFVPTWLVQFNFPDFAIMGLTLHNLIAVLVGFWVTMWAQKQFRVLR